MFSADHVKKAHYNKIKKYPSLQFTSRRDRMSILSVSTHPPNGGSMSFLTHNICICGHINIRPDLYECRICMVHMSSLINYWKEKNLGKLTLLPKKTATVEFFENLEF
jgi:hypothetical protein